MREYKNLINGFKHKKLDSENLSFKHVRINNEQGY